jgi:hypothetical protein
MSPKQNGKKDLFRQNSAKIARLNDTQHVLGMQHGHEHAACSMAMNMQHAAWIWAYSMDMEV